MFIKTTKLFICFLFIISTTAFASVRSNVRGIVSYPDQLHQAVDLINCLPEARDLLESIEREGSVKIDFTRDNSEFEAYWMGNSRTILLNPRHNRTVGEQICNIIFELNNAATDSKMHHQARLANQGTLSRSEYVEAIERIEHQNTVRACNVLNIGIQKRLFPKDAEAASHGTFGEYFKRQKQTGHSSFIARDFDRIAPHRAHERDDSSHYLAIRKDLESHNRDRIVNATLRLRDEFNKFDKEKRPNQRKKREFFKTFAGNPIFEALAR